jgi:Flp pilus assembly protein TadG
MTRNLGAPARLLRDTAGTGALELAMALPMLLLLLVGMVDVSRLIA